MPTIQYDEDDTDSVATALSEVVDVARRKLDALETEAKTLADRVQEPEVVVDERDATIEERDARIAKLEAKVDDLVGGAF